MCKSTQTGHRFYYSLLALLMLLAFGACNFGDELIPPGGKQPGNGTQQPSQPAREGGTTQSAQSTQGEGGSTESTQDTGGTGGKGGDSQQPLPPDPKVEFQLPKEWEFNSDYPNKARSSHHSKDGVKPYVVFNLHDIGPGNAADAKSDAQKDYQKRLQYCDQSECDQNLKYQEKKVAGVMLYISATTGHYWGTASWYSSIFFVKDGHEIAIDLDDLVENELPALEMAIQTLKVQ